MPVETAIFRYKSRFEVPAKVLFDWHKTEGALGRMIPPWQHARVIAHGGIRDGQKTVIKMGIPGTPFRRKWVAEHVDYKEGVSFADIQRKGPFAYWKHLHKVTEAGEGACFLEDEIQFKLPFSEISHRLFLKGVMKTLERAFAYRHRILAHDLGVFKRYPIPPKRILVSGSNGLIGEALVGFLSGAGHEVLRLVRYPSQKNNEVFVNPETHFINEFQVEGIDAVIHLAGENVGKRWSAKRKERILKSRQGLTAMLAQTVVKLKKKPEVFISASAIGLYGEVHQRPATEQTRQGAGFLAEVVKEWEAAAEPIKKAGIRLVYTRFGVVLSMKGGALRKLLLPFKWGVGGPVGSGNQYMSWIAIDDALSAIYHVLYQNTVTGPVNVVSPNPVTNAEFSRILGKVLRRPAFFTVPEKIIRFLFGEMGEETILQSQNIEPKRLRYQSFEFAFPNLKQALEHLLGQKARRSL